MMENILNLSSTGFDYFVLFCIEFAIGGNEIFYWEFERNFVSYFPFDICKKNPFHFLLINFTGSHLFLLKIELK